MNREETRRLKRTSVARSIVATLLVRQRRAWREYYAAEKRCDFDLARELHGGYVALRNASEEAKAMLYEAETLC